LLLASIIFSFIGQLGPEQLALKGQCQEIFASGFFDESVYHFEFFRKFAEIFAAQGLPPVSTTPVANGKNLQSENFL
jgi:hypothetical protein